MQYLDDLKKLGLTEREAKVYIALLKKSNFTAPEIPKLTSVPRTKIYEIIAKMVEKGLCIEKKIGKTKKYEAVNPEFVVNKLIQEFEGKKVLAQKIFHDLILIYNKNKKRVDPLEYIEVLKDIEQIRKKWLTLQKNAKKEILIFNKAPYAVPLTENLNEEIDVLKKNVKVKGVYEYGDITSESEKEELIMTISCYISGGEEARIVKELPMKLVIIDEKTTMFALNDPITLKPSITTIIISHFGFAKAQKYTFESVWEKATPFGEFMTNNKLRKGV